MADLGDGPEMGILINRQARSLSVVAERLMESIRAQEIIKHLINKDLSEFLLSSINSSTVFILFCRYLYHKIRLQKCSIEGDFNK
ncbi:hypothetical protein D3C76_483440 [compost metagenome]